jgi:hypothetical protein
MARGLRRHLPRSKPQSPPERGLLNADTEHPGLSKRTCSQNMSRYTFRSFQRKALTRLRKKLATFLMKPEKSYSTDSKLSQTGDVCKTKVFRITAFADCDSKSNDFHLCSWKQRLCCPSQNRNWPECNRDMPDPRFNLTIQTGG